MWRDSEDTKGYLDYSYIVNVAKDIIIDKDDKLTPSTIGLFGDWGCGKSSVMQMLKEDFNDKDDILCIDFNAWLFEDYEDAKSAFLETILGSINEKVNDEEDAKPLIKRLFGKLDFIKIASKIGKVGFDIATRGILPTATKYSISAIKEFLKKRGFDIENENDEKILDIFKNVENVSYSVKSFHKDFGDMLKATNLKRIVVFIDDLDRCNPDTIIDTLEAIRLFVFAEKTAFVIGADERQIRYAVQLKYPKIIDNEFDVAKEYLEKLIQYPIRIPQLSEVDVEFYIMSLLLSKRLGADFDEIKADYIDGKNKDSIDVKIIRKILNKTPEDGRDELRAEILICKQISSAIAKGLKGNPRHCKRFLNTLELRMKMADERELELEKGVLAKLMLVENFHEEFYKKLMSLQAKEGGKPKLIKKIEDNDYQDYPELKNDVWIQNWINIEPKLAKEDLSSYFTISNRKNIAQQISIEAEKILQDLLSGSEILRNKALKLADTILPFEADFILKTLCERIELSTKKNTRLKSIVKEWSEAREKEDFSQDILEMIEQTEPRISVKKARKGRDPKLYRFPEKLVNGTSASSYDIDDAENEIFQNVINKIGNQIIKHTENHSKIKKIENDLKEFIKEELQSIDDITDKELDDLTIRCRDEVLNEWLK